MPFAITVTPFSTVKQPMHCRIHVGSGAAMVLSIGPWIRFALGHQVEVEFADNLSFYRRGIWGGLIDEELYAKLSLDRASNSRDGHPCAPVKAFCGTVAQLEVILRRIDTPLAPRPPLRLLNLFFLIHASYASCGRAYQISRPAFALTRCLDERVTKK